MRSTRWSSHVLRFSRAVVVFAATGAFRGDLRLNRVLSGNRGEIFGCSAEIGYGVARLRASAGLRLGTCAFLVSGRRVGLGNFVSLCQFVSGQLGNSTGWKPIPRNRVTPLERESARGLSVLRCIGVGGAGVAGGNGAREGDACTSPGGDPAGVSPSGARVATGEPGDGGAAKRGAGPACRDGQSIASGSGGGGCGCQTEVVKEVPIEERVW